jgi:hypothetical protein
VKIYVKDKESMQIAIRAAQLARAYGIARGWKGTRFLTPVVKDGVIGISSPYKYLIYQNFGTKPRLMKELEGKVIPMKGGRFVTCKGVGTPGFVTLPGGVRMWRDQKWRHPGIKPTNFLENALNQSVKENLPLLSKGFKKLLSSETEPSMIQGNGGAPSGYRSI